MTHIPIGSIVLIIMIIGGFIYLRKKKKG